jgi:epoxyqueuosine reductase
MAQGLTTKLIKAKAAEIGFDLCGIARAERYPRLERLAEWVDRGFAGDMTYLAASVHERLDPATVLPGARSVICLALVYNTDQPYSNTVTSADRAAIARYAWGDDYHEVLRSRLRPFVRWMADAAGPGFEAFSCVDAGPVQERVFAEQAGLGWIGKNTCLINAEVGSWLFLAEIICTLALDPDTQGLEQCGSCTRCLDACPTGALVEGGVLDSTRCISYLTIELRSSIPETLRPSLGRHVYGCDICQEVCPYNRPAPVSSDVAWQPRRGLDLPGLVELWRTPDAELRRLTRESAMTRAKLTGLRRNIATAIGNSGDDVAIAALTERSDDRPSADDATVQTHVRWATAASAPSRRTDS